MAVVATAGHVDHGKSTLVRLLTGQEPDRWAEERRRGLTIDLGYAWTDIDGRRVSLVDVPGHEHFTGNMLAGLGPVTAVLFVVAADDGWSAQSQEHARAVAALGIEHVLLVVTRCDLADGAPARERVASGRLAALGVRGRRRRVLGVGRAPGPACPSCALPWAGLAAAAAPTAADATIRCGSGWTARSPSGARARWSPAPCRGAGSRWATSCCCDGASVRVRGLQTCGEEVASWRSGSGGGQPAGRRRGRGRPRRRAAHRAPLAGPPVGARRRPGPPRVGNH